MMLQKITNLSKLLYNSDLKESSKNESGFTSLLSSQKYV